MLLALTSVLVVGLPPLLDSLGGKRGQLIATFETSRGPRLSLLVHNAGNATAVIDANAVISVPTTYKPTGDGLLDAMLPSMKLDRVALTLDLPEGADGLIEPGRSREFEFVGQPPQPWSMSTDLEIEIVRGLNDKLFPDEIFGPLEDAGKGQADPSQPEVVGTKTERVRYVVEPMRDAARSWSEDPAGSTCELSVASRDVYHAPEEHRMAIPCDRVAGLYALLPSKVRVHIGDHVTEHEIVDVDVAADLKLKLPLRLQVDLGSVHHPADVDIEEIVGGDRERAF